MAENHYIARWQALADLPITDTWDEPRLHRVYSRSSGPMETASKPFLMDWSAAIWLKRACDAVLPPWPNRPIAAVGIFCHHQPQI
jgi:hypothetical protein